MLTQRHGSVISRRTILKSNSPAGGGSSNALHIKGVNEIRSAHDRHARRPVCGSRAERVLGRMYRCHLKRHIRTLIVAITLPFIKASFSLTE